MSEYSGLNTCVIVYIRECKQLFQIICTCVCASHKHTAMHNRVK